MRYCFYRSTEGVRVGAQAPWDPEVIVDVHRAEVVWLAARTGSRRAHEVARHLVPSDPGSFLLAGAAVWDFAREAVDAATADVVTPRGEPVSIASSRVELLPVLNHLLTITEPVGQRVAESPVIARVAAIVGRSTYRIDDANAWEAVAAYLDIQRAPEWLVTADELDDGDAEIYVAVAEVVSSASAHTTLQPGDVVCPTSIVDLTSKGSFATAAA